MTTAELERAQRKYHILRAVMATCAVAAVLVFSALMLWFSTSTHEVVSDIDRFTQCGSIPARQSVELHRQNAERLNALLRKQGMPAPPLPSHATYPPQCEEPS